MKPLGILLAIVGVAAALPPASTPAQPSLRVEDRADQPIFQLYVETVNPSCWCEDVLGERTVEAGRHVVIDLGDEKACRYDLAAVMKDGTRVSLTNADLCATHVWAVGPGAESRME
jgi:hypothetical protein